MKTETFPSDPKLNLMIFTLLDRYGCKDFSAKLKLYYCRYRSRRQLLSLSDERLRDIGISKEQALTEAQRPFWH